MAWRVITGGNPVTWAPHPDQRRYALRWRAFPRRLACRSGVRDLVLANDMGRSGARACTGRLAGFLLAGRPSGGTRRPASSLPR